jgi:hypothetical protein
MDALLDRLGCSARMAIGGDARALLGGTLDARGNPLPNPPPATSRLMRIAAPDAHALFPDTPIVPVAVWQPLQAKRVRYFPKPPAAVAAGATSATATTGVRRPAEVLARDPAGR